MGLDGVELIIAFEEAFGISITDAEAVTLATPRHVTDLIFSKIPRSDEWVCVSQRGFHLLRKATMQTCGVSRGDAVLGTDLRMLAAGRNERKAWAELREAAGAKSWPALVRPKWITSLIWLASLAVFGALLPFAHWAGALAAGVAIGSLAWRWTRRFRSRIPARFANLRALVPFAATSDAVLWTRDQVASRVRSIVIEQIGISESEYREDARFIEDFGID